MSGALRTAALATIVAACSSGATPGPTEHPHATRPGAARDASPQGATMSDVTIKSAGERPGRPPIVNLLVDVTLANPGGEPSWFLIPTKLPRGQGGVDKLEQLTAGATRLGRFLGTGGFYGVALAPGARVTLKNVEIAWWNEAGASVPAGIEVRRARDVTLGGQPIASWFDGDPAIGGTVEVDLDAAQHTRSHRTPDNREVAVAATGEATSTVAIAPR